MFFNNSCIVTIFAYAGVNFIVRFCKCFTTFNLIKCYRITILGKVFRIFSNSEVKQRCKDIKDNKESSISGY